MDVTKAIEEEVVSIHQKEKKNPNSYSLRDHGRWHNSRQSKRGMWVFSYIGNSRQNS